VDGLCVSGGFPPVRRMQGRGDDGTSPLEPVCAPPPKVTTLSLCGPVTSPLGARSSASRGRSEPWHWPAAANTFPCCISLASYLFEESGLRKEKLEEGAWSSQSAGCLASRAVSLFGVSDRPDVTLGTPPRGPRGYSETCGALAPFERDC